MKPLLLVLLLAGCASEPKIIQGPAIPVKCYDKAWPEEPTPVKPSLDADRAEKVRLALDYGLRLETYAIQLRPVRAACSP